LENRGFRVMRFWNNDVMRNLEGVWEAIVKELESPSPRPSPQGGEGVRRGR
jgi:very-short-patch-repair endonuclease